MSIQAINWAFSQKCNSPGEKSVLVALANYADDKGQCWPSQESLASMTSMTDRAVRANTVRLVLAGFIQTASRFMGGKHASNVYMLDLENKRNIPPPEESSAGRIQQKLPEESSAQPSEENHQERLIAKKRDRKPFSPTKYSPDFEAFWENSTRRGSKFEAYEAWCKIRPDPELVALMRSKMAAFMKTQDWLKENGKYAPHVVRWLRKRGWEQEVRIAKPSRPTGVVL